MVKRTKKRDFRWVSVKFIQTDMTGHGAMYSGKNYTYKVRRGAKVHVGQELIVHNDRGTSIVLVVAVDREPEGITVTAENSSSWKWIKYKVADL